MKELFSLSLEDSAIHLSKCLVNSQECCEEVWNNDEIDYAAEIDYQKQILIHLNTYKTKINLKRDSKDILNHLRNVKPRDERSTDDLTSLKKYLFNSLKEKREANSPNTSVRPALC